MLPSLAKGKMKHLCHVWSKILVRWAHEAEVLWDCPIQLSFTEKKTKARKDI